MGNVMKKPQGPVSRARWAAVGAAIAVSFGVGGVAVTNAVVSTGEKAVFIPIAPCRLFDLRPAPDQVGPRSAPLGPGETYTQTVQGANGNCTIPADATAVAMNVTAVGGTAGSFLTIYPSDVSPRPQASNLNWVPGSPPTPNKVDTKLSADGKINLFNLTGSVSVLADVVGYYADHNHDDRYYTKAEIDTKLNSEIVMSNDVMLTNNSGVPVGSVQFFTGRSRANNPGGIAQLSLTGPKAQSGVSFGLKSVTYCLDQVFAPAFVTSVLVTGTSPDSTVVDPTDRAADGCYTVTVNKAASTGFVLSFTFAGATGSIDLITVNTTWAPVGLIPASVPEAQPAGPGSGL